MSSFRNAFFVNFQSNNTQTPYPGTDVALVTVAGVTSAAYLALPRQPRADVCAAKSPNASVSCSLEHVAQTVT